MYIFTCINYYYYYYFARGKRGGGGGACALRGPDIWEATVMAN